MQYLLLATIIFSTGFSPVVSDRLETRDSSEIEVPVQLTREIRWPRRNIQIAFSTSLLSPSEQIKPGSDVVGAARRALSRWSNFADITFGVVWSSEQSVSPVSSADGVNLITVADTAENENFNRDSTTARTRVFFNSETGAITEADISINPHPHSQDGLAMQFSTDGTAGTYDLEATFTHEIGHLLGLDHSSVMASTMQSRQAFNGMSGTAAFTQRTLSEDDKQRIRKLYSPRQRASSVQGHVVPPTMSASRFAIFAESLVSGKLVASVVTSSDGSYSLNLEPGKYRVFAETVSDDTTIQSNAANVLHGEAKDRKSSGFDISSEVLVKPNEASSLDYNVESSRTSFLNLNPRWIGLNAELSTVALPVQPGKRLKVFIGGDGVDQVPASGISINSPYFSIDPSSLAREELRTAFPVISFDVLVAPNAPFGDYSIRMQSNSGELAHLPGAITIDPGISTTQLNPLDDANFFLTQQYADTFNGEADSATVASFLTELWQCGGRTGCLRKRKLDLSTSLLMQSGLSDDINFLNSLYLVVFQRRVTLSEFESVRSLLGRTSRDAQAKLALVLSVVQRPEFERKYPASMKDADFVEAILESVKQKLSDTDVERKVVLEKLDGTGLGRAVAIKSLLDAEPALIAHNSDGLVLAEYFTFLRRDPDEAGFAMWSNSLKFKVARDADVVRSLSCQFLNSAEYQHRFGMVATHSLSECN